MTLSRWISKADRSRRSIAFGVLYLAMLLILREIKIEDLKTAVDWLPIRRPEKGA